MKKSGLECTIRLLGLLQRVFYTKERSRQDEGESETYEGRKGGK